MGHGKTPRGIYNKMMGIRLIEGCGGKSILGLSTACFEMSSKGCGNIQDLVQDAGGWIKSGERKELRWIGKKQVWEKKSIKRAGQCACLSPACT